MTLDDFLQEPIADTLVRLSLVQGSNWRVNLEFTPNVVTRAELVVFDCTGLSAARTLEAISRQFILDKCEVREGDTAIFWFHDHPESLNKP